MFKILAQISFEKYNFETRINPMRRPKLSETEQTSGNLHLFTATVESLVRGIVCAFSDAICHQGFDLTQIWIYIILDTLVKGKSKCMYKMSSWKQMTSQKYYLRHESDQSCRGGVVINCTCIKVSTPCAVFDRHACSVRYKDIVTSKKLNSSKLTPQDQDTLLKSHCVVHNTEI